MKLSIVFFMIFFAGAMQAALKVEEEMILPFENKAYLIKDLIRDFAEINQLPVVYRLKSFDPLTKVHLQLNQRTNKDSFRKIVYTLLDACGLTPVEDKGFLWITESRDIRYMTTNVFTDKSFPADASYKTVIHRLKFPLASTASRNLRPYLSRYGRVVNFSDAKTLMFMEQGHNIPRLITLLDEIDTEVAYKNVLAQKPKAKEEDTRLKEKVLELEVDKKLLEKKMAELKEGQKIDNDHKEN